jgi:hypothetical protein
MRKSYKLPKHIRHYVQQELYDYSTNEKIITELEKNKTENKLINSRSFLVAKKNQMKIRSLYDRLSKEEKELVEIIFFKHCSQTYAETFYYISKDVYYNFKNKMIYLTAKELELI